METPGHTPESISVLVYEHAADTVPYGVLTGDALFIGDVGRPDLLRLVRRHGRRTRPDALRLDRQADGACRDTVRVFPAHGARGRSPKRSSTIGEQARTTAARLPVNEDDFVAHVEARRSSTPGYFVHDAALNRSVHDLLYVRVGTAGDRRCARAAGSGRARAGRPRPRDIRGRPPARFDQRSRGREVRRDFGTSLPTPTTRSCWWRPKTGNQNSGSASAESGSITSRAICGTRNRPFSSSPTRSPARAA